MKLKNGVFRLLRNEGKKLLPETYEVKHKYPAYVVQDNIKLAMENEGIVTEDDYSYPEEHLVNHGRRLKKVFKNSGMDGVMEYINKRKA